jgi:hypothetical protein
MSRRFWIFALTTLALAALACSAPGAATSAPTEEQQAPQVIVVTATHPPATAGRFQPTVVPPTAAPAEQPKFSGEIKFAETADVSQAIRQFHEGTTRIYALWTYSGMRAGLVVKREWLREGEQWIVKQEAWNFAKYGASGTVTDISIYDTEKSLPNGHYVLHLYIDGKPQFGADTSIISFEIVKAPAPP